MSPGIRSYLLGTQSDDRLVGLVRGGSEPAFEALVHRYRGPLLRYCRRLCGSEARAEEALQQALVNVWAALRRGAEVRDVRAWFYRIAHNAAVSSMRGERTALAEAAPEDLGGGRVAALAPAVGVSSLDDVLAVRDALAGMAALPQMQREVMVRTAVGGHSHEEVASALGISDGAVRGLLHRARCTLRAGMTAVTPTPLLTWAAGGPSPAAGERIAELAAGGGAAGLGGIAAKGGVLAITAGMAVAGSVIASHHGHAPSSHVPSAGARAQLFSAAGLGVADTAAEAVAATGPRGRRDGLWTLVRTDRRSLWVGRDRGGHGDGGGGSSGDRSRASDGSSPAGGDRLAGTSEDGGSSSKSSDGSSAQLDGSHSSGGSGDGGSGRVESQSGDGGLAPQTSESQLQTSSSDGGESIQTTSTSGGSDGGGLSSGSSDGGALKDSSSSSSTTMTSTSDG